MNILTIVLLIITALTSIAEDTNKQPESTRNAAEEAICRPFLVSKTTSPLLKHIPRDLKKDEDGEFSCELVLQDVNLPAQIRVTIHEGLSLLMIRHIALGKPRHKSALRHLRALSQIIPSKFSFSYNAGIWSLNTRINQPESAVQNFHNCVYGKAAMDKTVSTAEARNARRYYARTLAYLDRLAEALVEYGLLGSQSLFMSPVEFRALFASREAASSSLQEYLRN